MRRSVSGRSTLSIVGVKFSRILTSFRPIVGDAAAEYEDEANEIQDEEADTKAEYDAEIEELDESSGNAEGAEVQDESEENDDWYWEEVTYEYDDDMYDTAYWDYEWDNVWGEYA